MNPPIPFGKYRLVEQIAVGGMAEIFKAVALGLDGRRYLLAIKRILPQYSNDEEFISMLVDEAKVMVLLNHPNIVPIIEFGKIEDSYYIAMEYVHGVTLKELFRQVQNQGQPFSIDLAVHVVREIGTGLAYAHRKVDESGAPLEIVHRDVSPANVLLSFEGDVRLTDFGIAKASTQSHRTQIGIIRGKTGYMSPEQTRANTPVDQRSDIFSMGVILFELLTGDRLFKADTVPEALRMIRDGRIPPLRVLREDVPAELEGIVMRALALNADERYQSAQYFVDALNEFLTRWSPKGRPIRVNHMDVAGFLRRFFAERMAQPPAEPPQMTPFDELRTDVVDPQADPTAETQTKTGTTKPLLIAANPLYELSEPEKDLSASSTVKSVSKQVTAGAETAVSTSVTGRVRIVGASLARFRKPSVWGTVLVVAVAVVVVLATRPKKLPPTPKVVTSPGSAAVSPTAVPAPRASVTLKTEPPGARVLLEGKELPGRTPLQLPPLDPDREYTIRLEKKGYEPKKVSLKRKAGENYPAGFILTSTEETLAAEKLPKVGTPRPLGAGLLVARLNVRTDPWSRVFVDGKYIGDTPLAGATSIALSKGVHRIRYETDPKYFNFPPKDFTLRIDEQKEIICSYRFETETGVCKKK